MTAEPVLASGAAERDPEPPRLLVIGCGALARELRWITPSAGGGISFECLPAKLHNRPEQIPEAVRRRIRAARAAGWENILVGYMDCGTGGLLDKVCAEEGVERLPGVHCYELYAGAERFAELHEAEIGTLYLTDYLVRHFDRLILEGLGLAAHPELRDLYFGHYTRVLHLVQVPDPELDAAARRAAESLGLRYERLVTGFDGLGSPLLARHRWIVAQAGAVTPDSVTPGPALPGAVTSVNPGPAGAVTPAPASPGPVTSVTPGPVGAEVLAADAA